MVIDPTTSLTYFATVEDSIAEPSIDFYRVQVDDRTLICTKEQLFYTDKGFISLEEMINGTKNKFDIVIYSHKKRYKPKEVDIKHYGYSKGFKVKVNTNGNAIIAEEILVGAHI